MCGRAYNPRFLFSWPTSRCSVMGPDQLTGVMTQVAIQSAKAYPPPCPLPLPSRIASPTLSRFLHTVGYIHPPPETHLISSTGKELDPQALEKRADGFRR